MKSNGENALMPSDANYFPKLLTTQQKQIESTLPAHVSLKSFLRKTATALMANPKLKSCTPDSIVKAVMECAKYGFDPDGKYCAIIPYGSLANFQLMYHGDLDLAYRTGQYSSITVKEVCEKDYFEYNYGMPESFLRHIPADKNRGEIVKFWAGFSLKNGGYDFVVKSKEELMEHGRKFSKMYSRNDGAWQTHPDAMCKKTILLMALKLAPKSIEMFSDKKEEVTLSDITPTEEEIRNVTPEPEPKKQKVQVKKTKEEIDKDIQIELDALADPPEID